MQKQIKFINTITSDTLHSEKAQYKGIDKIRFILASLKQLEFWLILIIEIFFNFGVYTRDK